MKRKTYITPKIHVRRICCSHILAGSPIKVDNTQENDGTQYGKQGNGFDWGDTGWGDSKEESEDY